MATSLFCPPVVACLESRSIAPVCALRGPASPKPSYTGVDHAPHNAFFMQRFFLALQSELRQNPTIHIKACIGLDKYDAVMCSVRTLAIQHGTREGSDALSAASVRVLSSLLPKWLPLVFVTVFSLPVPRLAASMCAVVTVLCTQWLMGDSNVSADDLSVVEIKRCRYLEEAACAGICLHSCKTATEHFFIETMKLPLHIDPNFDDFSCKFRFGTKPPLSTKDPIFAEPCFTQCPISASQMQLCEAPLPSTVKDL